jgi:hypothetical protein
VLKYQWFRASGSEKPLIVVWETYAHLGLRNHGVHPDKTLFLRYRDQDAVEAHKTSSILAWLVENDRKEENMAAPISVIPLEQFAGWESRP